MITIWKFAKPLAELDDVIDLTIPADSIILSAGNQDEQLCVWAIVDDQKPTTGRRFRVAGTGHPLKVGKGRLSVTPGKNQFVGTVQFANGRLVFHVFDLGEP